MKSCRVRNLNWSEVHTRKLQEIGDRYFVGKVGHIRITSRNMIYEEARPRTTGQDGFETGT